MRNLNAKLLAPIMKLTGFRFSKDYRWNAENNNFYGWTYYFVNTVDANFTAGMEVRKNHLEG